MVTTNGRTEIFKIISDNEFGMFRVKTFTSHWLCFHMAKRQENNYLLFVRNKVQGTNI